MGISTEIVAVFYELEAHLPCSGADGLTHLFKDTNGELLQLMCEHCGVLVPGPAYEHVMVADIVQIPSYRVRDAVDENARWSPIKLNI